MQIQTLSNAVLGQTQMGQSLAARLRDFGLDPNDWQLIPMDRQSVRVIHKQDRDFRFVGGFDSRKGTWLNLRLESV